MGLAASQARLLNLTRRMHDIEYKAQNLEAQKLQMANESKAVYAEYENALNKQRLEYKYIDTDGSAQFKPATFADLFALGYTFKIWGSEQEDGSGADWHEIDKVDDLATYHIKEDSNQTISNMVEAGFIVFIKKIDGIDTEFNVATDTGLQQVSDETELKKAEAKYEADMRKINQKDKKFDTDLAAMDAERNAVKTEIETLKSIAKDNVDRTFKLFS